MGSGTGIAGIGLAKALKKSKFYLTEMSPGSLELMKENVALNSLDSDRV